MNSNRSPEIGPSSLVKTLIRGNRSIDGHVGITRGISYPEVVAVSLAKQTGLHTVFAHAVGDSGICVSSFHRLIAPLRDATPPRNITVHSKPRQRSTATMAGGQLCGDPTTSQDHCEERSAAQPTLTFATEPVPAVTRFPPSSRRSHGEVAGIKLSVRSVDQITTNSLGLPVNLCFDMLLRRRKPVAHKRVFTHSTEGLKSHHETVKSC